MYTACLRGIHGRERCQSIDLFTPKDGRNHTFALDLKAPDSLPPDLVQDNVTFQQLQIPAKAMREFARSVEAEIQDNEQGMVSHLNRALEIEPSYAEALNNLGAYYLRTGNEKLALQFLTKAMQVNPSLYSGWVNLAGALLVANRWEEALKAALNGLALRPEDPLSNSLVARCYYYMDRLPQAEQYFKKVLALDPLYPDPPMIYLAWISVVNNREKEAEDYLRLFLKLHPYFPNAATWSDTLHSLISSSKAAPVATAQK